MKGLPVGEAAVNAFVWCMLSSSRAPVQHTQRTHHGIAGAQAVPRLMSWDEYLKSAAAHRDAGRHQVYVWLC